MKPIPYVVFYGCRHSVTRDFVARCLKESRNAPVGRATRRKSFKYKESMKLLSLERAISVTYVTLTMDAGIEKIKFVYTK